MTGQHFLDGDDLCAGCGVCCHDVEALRVTESELERLPRLSPYVTSRESGFLMLDIPGPCPYLLEDGRCGTFDSRPFDCSLYPVNIASIGIRRPDGVIPVHWMFTAGECPERPEIVARARRQRLAGVDGWVAETVGGPVELIHHGRLHLERLATLLHRLGLLDLVRRVTGRAPLPRKPSSP